MSANVPVPELVQEIVPFVAVADAVKSSPAQILASAPASAVGAGLNVSDMRKLIVWKAM